jgi:hypothetical protein
MATVSNPGAASHIGGHVHMQVGMANGTLKGSTKSCH